MTEMTAQPLEPLLLPLQGARLIEASAGTGKTYTIAALYLRLLLGLGGETAFPRPLGVEELLVVTFTEAATEELRGRIRANIHALRIACIRNHADDPLLSQMLAQILDKAQAARTLLLAERQMDEAAIFTIHGFCQRMLNLNAFESGMLFEQQLIEDESALFQQASADFWRRHCYPLEKSIARAVSEIWSGPQALLRDVRSYLQGDAPRLKQAPRDDETLAQRHEKIVQRIDEIKAQWLAAAAEIGPLISTSGVDKRSFSSKNLPNWLEKVGQWATEPTASYALPDALAKFAQSFLDEKTKKGEVPRHPLFSAIEQLLAEPLSLRDLMMARAIAEIRYTVANEKRKRAELGFDDMLSRLDDALRLPSGPALAQAIRSRYPAAMIDEFQDTDPQQYRIFNRLYINQPETVLLLIGDPKQAIYAFRGADIFTYMKARKEVSAHYTLDTNWRSSPAMIEAVNQVFGLVENPFLFRDIPFLPVKSAAKNQGLRFEVDGVVQPALTLWTIPGDGVGVSEYQQAMATRCAGQIRDWLSAGQAGTATLSKGDKPKPVSAADITVLVRSRGEAALIRDALSALNIQSVYLSNRDSVFITPEAREILAILQAALTPEHEATLRSAIATSLIGLDAAAIDGLNQNETAWDSLVEEFHDYHQIWLRRGVMPMLRMMLSRRQIAENILATPGGERRLTDILHISELLQEAAVQLDSEHGLVRWLAQHIAEPDTNASSQQLRLESDKHLVQVVTIHKSKGLEYAIVCLPFIASYRAQAQALYHDRSTYETLLDLAGDETSMTLAEEERLAEDLRLLYVALTRSIWHCSLGIAPLFRGNRGKKGPSDFHLSGLGYLLQKGEALTGEELEQALAQSGLEVEPVKPLVLEPWQPVVTPFDALSACRVSRSPNDDWRVTSYSGLQQHGTRDAVEWVPRLDMDAAGEQGVAPEPQFNAHTFPRGAAPGTFLHSLFEGIDFTQPVDEQWLEALLQKHGFDLVWLPVLQGWLEQVLAAPLTPDGICLNQLSPADTQVELAFYLPITEALQSNKLDALIRANDPLSAGCPPLDFYQVRGMLKGFIDLVFRWEGRYYLLDYKSNWLGENSEFYTPEAMAAAMQTHRYDLQYQLYTLALHRYLRHRIADYDYDTHFGGVIYLFLRGAADGEPGQGVFSTRPSAEFVEAMSELFEGVPVL